MKREDLFICTDISDQMLREARKNIEAGDFKCSFRFTKLQSDKDARLPFIRGLLLVRQKRYEEAIPMYESAIKKDPTKADYYFNLAVAHYELKQWDGVEKAARKVIEIQPKHANALNFGCSAGA